jgi:hypothetical protein
VELIPACSLKACIALREQVIFIGLKAKVIVLEVLLTTDICGLPAFLGHVL